MFPAQSWPAAIRYHCLYVCTRPPPCLNWGSYWVSRTAGCDWSHDTSMPILRCREDGHSPYTKRKEATAIYLIISISILKTFQHIKCRILWFCEIVELIRTAKAKTNTCFLLLKRFTLKAILSAKLCKYLNSNINLEEAYTTLDLYLQYIKAIVCIIRVS